MRTSDKKAIFDHEKRDAIKYVDRVPDPVGEVEKNKLPIIGADGTLRGVMGTKAGEACARRVGNLRGGAKLGTHKGRPAWIETVPATTSNKNPAGGRP